MFGSKEGPLMTIFKMQHPLDLAVTLLGSFWTAPRAYYAMLSELMVSPCRSSGKLHEFLLAIRKSAYIGP